MPYWPGGKWNEILGYNLQITLRSFHILVTAGTWNLYLVRFCISVTDLWPRKRAQQVG